MKYDNITIYYDKDKNFKKAIIKTKYGDLEINSKSEFDGLIEEYATQIGLSVDEILKNDGFVKIIREVSEKKASTSSTIDLTDKEIDEIISGLDGYKSKKKKSWIKRLVAGSIVVVVLGTGAYHLDKHKGILGGKVYAIFNPEKNIEISIDNNSNTNENSDNTNDNSINQNNASTHSTNSKITSVSSGKDNTGEYDKNMAGVIKREESNSQIIPQIANGTVTELSKEQLLETLNDHSRIANSSIFEVSQYINDRGLNGTAYYYNFENLFNKDSMDYTAVKMFSDLRNSIVYNVFEERNKSAAKAKIKSLYDMFTEFVFSNNSQKFAIGNQKVAIKFNDLSDMAKTTILEIGSAMLTVDYDYSYNDGNYYFEKEEILNNSVSMLQGELIPGLINRSHRR